MLRRDVGGLGGWWTCFLGSTKPPSYLLLFSPVTDCPVDISGTPSPLACSHSLRMGLPTPLLRGLLADTSTSAEEPAASCTSPSPQPCQRHASPVRFLLSVGTALPPGQPSQELS